MEPWQVLLTKQGQKDLRRLDRAELQHKVLALLEVLQQNPYQPTYEKLMGELKGKYSRRINIQHRLVYSIDEENKIIKILKAYEHY